MAASLNRVVLVGQVNSDPVMRQLSAYENGCCFGLTVTTQSTTLRGQTIQDNCFLDVEATGNLAQQAQAIVRREMPLFVMGRLRYVAWQDPLTGRRQSKLVIRAEQLQNPMM